MGDAETTSAELEGWVRTELGLSDDVGVAIAEQPGADPRCSDTVTVVTVSAPGDAPWSFHIEAPLADMVPMDLVAALAFGGGH